MARSCNDSIETRAGKIDLTNSAYVVVAHLAGLEVPIRSARHLRLLEGTHGRLTITTKDITGDTLLTTISSQATNSATAGVTALEKMFGSAAASAAVSFTAIDPAQLARRIASSPDPGSAAAAVSLAASLRAKAGTHSHWTRQLSNALNPASASYMNPADLESALSLIATPTGPVGGLVPRDLNSAMFASSLVRASHRFTAPPPATQASEHMKSLVLDQALDARFWSPSPADIDRLSDQFSGYKLHVYCEDFDEVTAAYTALAPTLHARGLAHKIASRHLADAAQGDALSQARKGVTVYLPEASVAVDDISASASALGHRASLRAPGDDIHLGSGLGLRYELVVDTPVDVSFGSYSTLYKPASSRQVFDDAVTTAASSIRSITDQARVDPEQLAGWLDIATQKESWADFTSNQTSLTRAARLAAARAPLPAPAEADSAFHSITLASNDWFDSYLRSRSRPSPP